MTEQLSVQDLDGSPALSWVPVEACTLPTSEQPVRVAEFDALFAETLTNVEQTSASRARFLLTGGADVARRAQGLVDLETACCSFFVFTITATNPMSVVVDVAVPSERAEVLAALVARAQEKHKPAIEGEPA